MFRATVALFRSLRLLFSIVRQNRAAEITWLPAVQYPVVVLDQEGQDFIKPLLQGVPALVLPVRGERLYFNRQVILGTISNLARLRNPLAAYSLAVIEFVGAKLVVTYIDNSAIYHAIAPLCKGVNFLAFQNGVRCLERDVSDSNKIQHNHFVCFGESHEDMYRRFGATVGRYYPLGSLRDACYRTAYAERPAVEYDFCLISEVEPGLDKMYPQLWAAIVLLARYLAEYCRENGCHVCVASRADPLVDREIFSYEEDFYKRIFAGTRFTMIGNNQAEFRSYRAVDASDLSFCVFSTLGLEAFGRGRKVLFFNSTKLVEYDLPEQGIWALGCVSYQEFEQRLDQLRGLGASEYAELQGLTAARMMNVVPAPIQTSLLPNLIRSLATSFNSL